jgi:hypothetical protein
VRVSLFSELSFAYAGCRSVIEFFDETLRACGFSMSDFEIFEDNRSQFDITNRWSWGCSEMCSTEIIWLIWGNAPWFLQVCSIFPRWLSPREKPWTPLIPRYDGSFFGLRAGSYLVMSKYALIGKLGQILGNRNAFGQRCPSDSRTETVAYRYFVPLGD